MKFFIIASLALAAIVCADDQDFSMKHRMEKFNAKKSEMREKWASMTEEERQKVREEHHAKMSNRPVHQFSDIPEEHRQKMREKFEKLSPEERQKIHDRFQRRYGAVAYNTEDDLKITKPIHAERPKFSDEDKQKIREKFEKMTPEDKQKIRESIEKLTPEQREEIRKHVDYRQRNPALSGPVPAAADGDFQKIRTRDVNPDRRNPRFPVHELQADRDFEKIRSREDDIMVHENKIHELQADRRKPRL
jgi:DNA-binding MarR family transcriptional regulator